MNSNFETEYKAVREHGAGLFEFPGRGLIEVSGGEAVQFLNGMLTNDIAKLPDREWMLAAFPNVQGRLLSFVRILKIGDRFLFDTEDVTREKVFNNLFRFTFAGDFKVNDLTEQFYCLRIRGNNLSDFNIELPQNNEVAEFDFKGVKILLISAFRENGFDAFVPATQIFEDFWEYLTELGAIRISNETAEVLRIEAGIPRYAVDMDETTVVLETGLDEAVSFTKGCYIGQEVIIRIHHRGHVAKKLAGLIFEEPTDVAPNSELKSKEGKNAGRVTSVTFSPALNKQIALAYVRYDFLEPGTELLVEGETPVRVASLPFLKNADD